MIRRNRGLLLLAIQMVLVLSIAAKYVYERKVCPRAWARTTQADPSLPLRGKYLALRLDIDACSLPKHKAQVMEGPMGYRRWRVKLEASENKLVATLADDATRPEDAENLTLWQNQTCDRATLSDVAEYFVGDRARNPFTLKAGQELWVEVTVPPSGPPRPIRLALKSAGDFKPLQLD
jgi:uncharacterized membrane-anchored protein